MARGSLCFVSMSVKSFYLFYVLFSLIKKLDYVNLIKNMLKKRITVSFFGITVSIGQMYVLFSNNKIFIDKLWVYFVEF